MWGGWTIVSFTAAIDPHGALSAGSDSPPLKLNDSAEDLSNIERSLIGHSECILCSSAIFLYFL